jgi:photosystem II stability/assembly factor-like uncharacterized protein
LTDILFWGSTAGWISGEGGILLQTTSTTASNAGLLWIPRSTGTDGTLRALFFINDKTGWAVGDNGTILYTVDGGIFWVKQFKR